MKTIFTFIILNLLNSAVAKEVSSFLIQAKSVSVVDGETKLTGANCSYQTNGAKNEIYFNSKLGETNFKLEISPAFGDMVWIDVKNIESEYGNIQVMTKLPFDFAVGNKESWLNEKTADITIKEITKNSSDYEKKLIENAPKCKDDSLAVFSRI